MKSMEYPKIQGNVLLSARYAFEACVNATTNHRLLNLAMDFDHFERIYIDSAQNGEIHKLTIDDLPVGITKKEMLSLYDKMVSKKSSARILYDRIFNSAKYNRCPYCDSVEVTTLDHYLPKSKFPAYSVAPLNLVPACSICQRDKNTYYPTSQDEEYFHPYIDNINDQQWLFADIPQSNSTKIQYDIRKPHNASTLLHTKIENHFYKVLKLNLRYPIYASVEISERAQNWQNMLNQSQSFIPVKQWIQEELQFQVANNHWKTAFYKAAENNDWFCNGGFNAFIT